jgi:hypothetical protein
MGSAAGIKPPACRVLAFSWTGGFIKTAGGFFGRFIYGGFILNLAAVRSPSRDLCPVSLPVPIHTH